MARGPFINGARSGGCHTMQMASTSASPPTRKIERKRRAKELREVRCVLRKAHSEQEQREQLSKMEMLKPKSYRKSSRRALAQLLSKARRRQKRTKPMKEQED